MISLLVRMYDPDKGAILIDGINIKDMRLSSLREGIGIALQEPFLWNDTVKNNILYGKENAHADDVIRAARIAETHDFVIGLPDGYDTVIGENACKISEGQKQRIAIARAVIKKPKILILDEAMSSLDSKTEDRVIDNIKKEFMDSTLIIVSHRLSTARKMDMVYFLQDSSTMKIGTHEELMANSDAYKELFASQLTEDLTAVGEV